MRKIIKILIICAAFGLTQVYAAETMNEKAQAMANDMERGAKKAIHRIDEATCMDSKLECMKEKAEHRVEEATEVAEDQKSELENSIDNE